jgi:hypothetical protein
MKAPKGYISVEDARIIHDFAIHVQPLLRHDNHTSLLKNAQTVQRIAYCVIAQIRQQVRAERARRSPTVADDDYPYPIEEREPHESAIGRMADESE